MKVRNRLTGLEMTRMLALGEASAAALARSRTIEALVLNRSRVFGQSAVRNGLRSSITYHHGSCRASGAHQPE